MKDRTMVKVTGSGELLDLRTVSRTRKSPGSFSILRETLIRLEREQRLIISSMESFAVLWFGKKENGQQILELDITWLRNREQGGVGGWKEHLRLPYEPFHKFAETSGNLEPFAWCQLSIPETTDRKLEFQSHKTLHEVVQNPILRRKLGKLLARLQWKGTEKIVIYDDFIPFSFYFKEYTCYGPGICGGILLSQTGDLKTAQYSVHT